MEYCIELRDVNKNIDYSKLDRIYYSDPFCQKLIPTKENLKKALLFAKEKEIKFTLNTPFVNDEGIKQILNNIDYISKYDENCEVVFNDFGVFYEVKQRFPRINLILGRLLTKQRTDPNIAHIITNSQPKEINNVKIKKVPNSLFRLFQGSVINDDKFQQYLLYNDINRVEIEFLVWDMSISLPKSMQATVYYPFAHVATTRQCGLLYMTYGKCSMICKRKRMKYNNIYDYPYMYIGNTLYYNIENIITEDKLKQYPNIDRIVFNDIDAYNRFFIGKH